MHGRVTLCLIVAALGILVASPAVLAAAPTTTGSAPSASTGTNCATARHAVDGSAGQLRLPLVARVLVARYTRAVPARRALWRWHHDGHVHLAGPALRADDGGRDAAARGVRRLADVDIHRPRQLYRHLHAGPGRRSRRMAGRGLASAPRCPHARPGRPRPRRSELNLPAPTVSTAPSGGKAIVNLESWLWIDPADWTPITKRPPPPMASRPPLPPHPSQSFGTWVTETTR